MQEGYQPPVEPVAERPETKDIRVLIEGLQDDPIVQRERALLAEDPELKELYDAIIVRDDKERLKEKSFQQLADLTQRYFGTPSFSFAWIKEYIQKRKKLERFEDYVASLTPVRSDREGFPEFKSPEKVGFAKSFGPYDVLCHAERFVYASFAEIAHGMAQGRQWTLDVEDIAPRAHIVMNDIANVAGRCTEEEPSCMKRYIHNMFDFEHGKKILAVYFASIFDTPEQAQSVMTSGYGGGQAAQRWDSIDGAICYVDRNYTPRSTEDFQEQKRKEQELSKVFYERMVALFHETGIEPPLSIEIRIKDSAKRVM